MSLIPIVVGVGDFVNRSTALADAHEPLTLILNAIELALKDAGLPEEKRKLLQAAVDSIDVVRTWTWPYDDLPGDIARELGVEVRHSFYTEHAGNQPAKRFDLAAKRIARGETKVAVITGGEALASCMLVSPKF
jgi:acetyl-CoA acetyltransferase